MNKNYLKGGASLLVLALLALGIFSATSAKEDSGKYLKGESFVAKDLGLEKDYYIIDYRSADVTGDDKNDDIILVGNKMAKEDIFADQLTIVLKNSKTGKYEKASYEGFCGYKGELFIGDFSGDKINDVMVSATSGGSNGVSDHMIATFEGENPKVIFNFDDNKGIELEGKFIDGFKAQYTLKELDKTISIDISSNKDMYVESEIYSKEGKLLKETTSYIYPFGLLEAVDYDGNGTYELKGYQRIVGAFNADTVSTLESFWSFSDSNWNLNELKYSTFIKQYSFN